MLTLLLAAVAGYAGTAAAWDGHPLGVSLQFGFGAALAVFALGLVVSSFLGRTGFVTVLMTVVTALLLAGASAIPSQIDTVWTRAEWAPASIGDLRPRYALGSGVGSLDLSALDVPRGRTVGVAAEVGAGRLAVTVPAGVTVRARAQAGLGDIRLPGPPATGSASDWSEPASSGDPEVAADLDVTRTVPPPPGAAPGGTLELDLRIGVGRVEVVRAAS
ncbi:hypothetical protein [Streptomyces somaliensis]|uniref:hypothetical protein n=1 Tax=Streptomyces somaliensis TaxID=78355 RepID=UPI0034E95EDA|nr:cell wall-active antibiotics response protein [Streptomyces somaliensis]